MTFRRTALWLTRLQAGLADRRAAAAMEFAMVAIPFVMTLMFTFELAYDLFLQEALDSALHQAARQLQTGNAQNVANASTFIAKYLCPAATGLLSCGGVYISVQKLNLSAAQDYWNVTTGVLPVTAGALDLSKFGSTSFCNTGPSQLLLVQAIYVSPTFVGALVPKMSVFFGGSRVHATLSQVGAVTENFAATPLTAGFAPAC